jgi:hypothetical protein
MCIVFRSGMDSGHTANETEFVFENPRVTEAKEMSNNRIGNTGMGNGMYNNNTNQALLDMQKQMFEMQLSHHRDLAERDKQDLVELIQATEAGQKTFWDKIFDLAEKPAAKVLITGLMAKITGQNLPTSEVKNEIGSDEADEDEGYDQDEETELATQIHSSLNTIKPVFNDVGAFLMELAAYIKKNPQNAHQLRTILKQETNG